MKKKTEENYEESYMEIYNRITKEIESILGRFDEDLELFGNEYEIRLIDNYGAKLQIEAEMYCDPTEIFMFDHILKGHDIPHIRRFHKDGWEEWEDEILAVKDFLRMIDKVNSKEEDEKLSKEKMINELFDAKDQYDVEAFKEMYRLINELIA